MIERVLISPIAVTGDIPDPVRAFKESRRVLKHTGKVAISEILVDPGYPQARTVTRWAAVAGRQPVGKIGGLCNYADLGDS